MNPIELIDNAITLAKMSSRHEPRRGRIDYYNYRRLLAEMGPVLTQRGAAAVPTKWDSFQYRGVHFQVVPVDGFYLLVE